MVVSNLISMLSVQHPTDKILNIFEFLFGALGDIFIVMLNDIFERKRAEDDIQEYMMIRNANDSLIVGSIQKIAYKYPILIGHRLYKILNLLCEQLELGRAHNIGRVSVPIFAILYKLSIFFAERNRSGERDRS